MSATAGCPRCGGVLRPPGLMSSAWECESHGAVHPFTVAPRVSAELLAREAARAGVPVWVPSPLLPLWTLSGFGSAGDLRSNSRATVVALSGPSPLGGPADLLLVAEEPGVGLGARLSGAGGVDPGKVPDGPPEAKVAAAGHPTAMWRVPSEGDRAAFVGEAGGVWLWAVLWPPAAELLLIEQVVLQDARHGVPGELPVGAPTSRLG